MTDDLQQRAEECARQLYEWCIANGRWVSPDRRVKPETAAEILGVTHGTLSNWRSQGVPLPYFRPGARGGVTYRLSDLALRIESELIT